MTVSDFAPWDSGYSLGTDGRGWVAAVAAVCRAAARPLTAAERVSFAAGWRAGREDRRRWALDMASGCAAAAWDGV